MCHLQTIQQHASILRFLSRSADSFSPDHIDKTLSQLMDASAHALASVAHNEDDNARRLIGLCQMSMAHKYSALCLVDDYCGERARDIMHGMAYELGHLVYFLQSRR